VTTTNAPFGNGIIRFDQTGTSMGFEERLLGGITDSVFTIGEDGLVWISGTVTGDTLHGRYSVPLAGMAATNDFVAVRYSGPMYDVWQGTNALTANQNRFHSCRPTCCGRCSSWSTTRMGPSR
jgi:hypothetical protein